MLVSGMFSQLVLLAGTAAAPRTAAPLLSCPWWATSWAWEIATERTSYSTHSRESAFTSTSTASSTRFAHALVGVKLIFLFVGKKLNSRNVKVFFAHAFIECETCNAPLALAK